ncbi:hypothetical protein EUTSA_v10012962mg [Eutrema salsugineum]|uniref:ABC transporter domain-containing protein n=2 Tax=Eutrema salsugineum TaxID=72664 RepID=V4LE12_EUTSA|nr:hypothetical protein EUTSA_v10012962mg [Eutrema salsugineum]
MASCFHPSPMATNHREEDSIILFSASNSPDEFSSASSSFSSSPLPTPNRYSLTVTNLSYTIHHVNILNSVSFAAESSKILAVVGPSGTGKSTLLKIISGRVSNKALDPSSAISINDGRISDYNQLRKLCGFVPQDDDLLPLLTVKETLMYSAKFSLRESTAKEREDRVESLLRDLGLVLVQDSFVGEGDEEDRGVSGGERKRVSIAVEMIRDPPILLLDEPTSGLDSRNSLQVVELLSSMAKSKQRTVVFSIHQPSYRILDYISDYLILSRGSVIHIGNLEHLEDSIAKLGFQIPEQLNPIEFAMEIVESLRNSNHKDSSRAVESSSSSSIWRENSNEYDGMMISTKQEFRLLDIAEISFLCSRFCKIIYRTKQLFLARTMQAVVAGLGLGSVYTRLERDEESVAERLGLFAFSLSFLLSSTVEALPIYLRERRVLMKESSRGSYRISSYMIANTIAFVPFLFVVSLLFSIPVYWIVGLNPSIQAFSFFVLCVWLIILMASSLVLFLSAVSPDFISGNSLICTVLGAFFLFSGYFIPKDKIPKPWLFMYYVSLYRYPLESMLVNEYWSVREVCFSGGDLGCLMTGEDVLKKRGLDKDTRWINVGIMLAFFVFYRFLCWGILLRKASKSTL